MATIKKSTVKQTVTKKLIKKAQNGIAADNTSTGKKRNVIADLKQDNKQTTKNAYNKYKSSTLKWADDVVQSSRAAGKNDERKYQMYEAASKVSRQQADDASTNYSNSKKNPRFKNLNMKNGGSLSAIKKTSSKRAGSVDPKGAFTTVQKRTLAGAKGKASLTKDKQLGATKMAKCGTSMSKKK
jgi:hypothetical protein